MKKCILTFLVFTCIGISDSMSQNNKGTFTLGYGCSLLGDVAIAPYNKGMMDNGLSKTTSITGVLKKDFSVSLISLYFQMNTLLKEFNANTSLSFNASPGIRCSVGNYGFGSANMPITINFNKGMLSSFNSDATTGVTFGIGANILTSTLFNLGDKEFNPFIYAQPCVQLGFRFFTRRYEEPYEVMLQAGYLPLKNADVLTTNNYYGSPQVIHNSISNSSTSLRISVVKYLNY